MPSSQNQFLKAWSCQVKLANGAVVNAVGGKYLNRLIEDLQSYQDDLVIDQESQPVTLDFLAYMIPYVSPCRRAAMLPHCSHCLYAHCNPSKLHHTFPTPSSHLSHCPRVSLLYQVPDRKASRYSLQPRLLP